MPPVNIGGLPNRAATLKWDNRGRLCCLGNDANGVRRLWRWPKFGQAPETVTPSGEHVLDYSIGDTGQIAWLSVPPLQLKPGPVSPVLRLREESEESVRELELPAFLFGYVCYSPDGSLLAFVAREPERELSSPQLWVLDPARWPEDGSLRCVTAPLEGVVKGYDWTPDSTALVASVQTGLTSVLALRGIDGGDQGLWPPDAQSPTYLSGPHVDRSRGRLLYLQQGSDLPQRLMLGELARPESAVGSRPCSARPTSAMRTDREPARPTIPRRLLAG